MEEKIKDTALFIGILTIISYLKEYFYYNYYNIDISDYMNIEEALTPFIDELAVNFIILAVTAILLFKVFANYSKAKQQWKNQRLKQFIRIRQKMIKVMPIIGNLLIVIFCVLFIRGFFFGDREMMSAWLMGGFFLVYKGFVYIGTNLTRTSENYRGILIMISSILLIIMLDISWLFEQFGTKKNQYKNLVYKFELNNGQKIETDSLNLYLGRTKNHFFIFNPANDKVKIYNTATIIYEEKIKLK